MSTFLGNIDTLYLSMIAVWLLFSAFFAYREIMKKSKNKYIDSVTVFSAMWFTISFSLSIYYLKDVVSGIANRLFLFSIAMCVSILVAFVCCLIYSIKKKIKLHYLALCLVILGAAFYFMIFFDVNFTYVAYGLLGVFIVLCFCLLIIGRKKDKSMSILGLLCSALVAAVTITLHILFNDRNPNLLFYIELLLSICAVISFMLYFSQLYAKSVTASEAAIDKKDDAIKQIEDELRRGSLVNQDTGLANIHRLQKDYDSHVLKFSHLLMLNLDNYKMLYNSEGYKNTVEIMKKIGKSLDNIVGDLGFLYHISNDKFIIALDCTNEECGKMVRKVLDLFTIIDFCAINLKPYVGFTSVENRATNFESILKELELASESAKVSKDFYAAYTYEMYKKIQRRLLMETHLKNAVAQKNWDLYLQPKVLVKNNICMGAEGLIRWKGQEGRISPAAFIPLAEELGLIIDIGKTIIEKGFIYAKTIAETVMPNFVMAVNLSAYQLMRKDFVDYVLQAVDRCGVKTKNVSFEVTESAFIENMDRVKNSIVKLREAGFKFSLDDFGTGYSSISYLSRFELDEVKFDKEFMEDISRDRKNLIILETVTSLAKKLNLKIVTEGVESEEQLAVIRQVGCDLYQGYYFSKPISFDEFVVLLKRNLNGEYHGNEK